MKSTAKLILPIALIALAGVTQAGEPVEDQASDKTHEMMSHMDSEMPMKGEMPMMEEAEKGDAAMAGTRANKAKHNHRKFKGLPSGPTPDSADDDASNENDEKAEDHDHRKKHK